MTTVRPERTGERHLDFSTWHRVRADRECFMTDIDALEYRRGREGVALIETKFGDTGADWSQATAQIDLADRAGLPLFLVNYHHPGTPADWEPGQPHTDEEWGAWQFRITPMNDIAKRTHHARYGTWITESEFQAFLRDL